MIMTSDSGEAAPKPMRPAEIVEDEPPPSGCTLPSPAPAIPIGSPKKWDDWRWQMANRIRSPQQLLRFFPELRNGSDLTPLVSKYPMAITPYYASLIHEANPGDPIFQMAVPQMQELIDPPFLSPDPLEECHDMPVPGMVHRYPDRALVIATTMCSTYCRHCTRKRVAGTRETSISKRRLEQIAEYLQQHPQIHDVIISGGDPLTLRTDQLEMILSRIRQVPSVQIIRIGTRVPVVLPQRITENLCRMIQKYHPIWINTHFNHPRELTPESTQACQMLANAGVPLGNQSVLLKGINDRPQIIEELCRGLVRNRVRPYYLYQCDLVRGVEHFRTRLSRGIEIMEYLRGRLSGLAIPLFVVDAPHGGGKIPVLPTYLVTQSPTHTVLRNYEGMLIAYPEPHEETMGPVEEPKPESSPGVWEMLDGQNSVIRPEQSVRLTRRRQCCPAGNLSEGVE
ncbi:MAG: KamA family radical SAM protein [Sedimentisphaerales bacterium]|nr:KamA family radical SAM protein [Sedimentisphaerales bacterium]